MEQEHRGVALVILGVISVVAVIGLVLMFSGARTGTGMIFTSATDGEYVCPMSTQVGEPQWFPVLAGPWENPVFLDQWINAGYECDVASGPAKVDEYGYATYCCRNPPNVPVNQRGPVPLETRQGSGVQVGSEYDGNFQYAAPPGQQHMPRVGP